MEEATKMSILSPTTTERFQDLDVLPVLSDPHLSTEEGFLFGRRGPAAIKRLDAQCMVFEQG